MLAHRIRPVLLQLFLLPAIGIAATSITDVVNFGSRIGSGLPGSGIAQGAIFAVTGIAVGPDQAVQGAFPLTTTDGLGGVTVSITTGGATINAIMVYVSPTEVDAILPSATPLGAATVTLNNNGAMATFPINVVAAAFGTFTTAGVFNVASDGSLATNNAYQSAQPGQTVTINGTGLGAIASDETMSGATDVPAATVNVWVGTTPATVVSAGRGTCCAGIDPNFPIPQGVAAWDVITFIVPDGTIGCQVTVTVQAGTSVGNTAKFAVAPGGGTCPEAANFNSGSALTLSGPVKQGLVTVMRNVTNVAVGTTTVVSTADSASALFVKADYGPNPVPVPPYASNLQASVGSCFVVSSRLDRSAPQPAPPPAGPQPVFLDAGTAITMTTPKSSQILKNQKNLYSATTVLTQLTVPGVPASTSGGPDFILPGAYTLDNGSGGADIGAFKATLNNPTPVVWTNAAQITPIARSQGATVKWTGGDQGGVVAITGSSSSLAGSIVYAGFFVCYAAVSAQQFAVPAFVTQQMPASGTVATGGSGSMTLQAITADVVNIPNVDVTYYFSQAVVGGAVVFQ